MILLLEIHVLVDIGVISWTAIKWVFAQMRSVHLDVRLGMMDAMIVFAIMSQESMSALRGHALSYLASLTAKYQIIVVNLRFSLDNMRLILLLPCIRCILALIHLINMLL
jgi:hypothetical protein